MFPARSPKPEPLANSPPTRSPCHPRHLRVHAKASEGQQQHDKTPAHGISFRWDRLAAGTATG